ncbi:MAG: hypothetical protein OXF77_02600 [Thaumarchaeota archaeon]|nr:hypothetical protein [Nitrososphaerota archaeon]
MLRTNLATRPFYNERAVHVVLALAGAAALVGLAAGIARAVDVVRSQAALTTAAEAAERDAAQLAGRAATVRQAIAAGEVESIAEAVAEANRLVDRRTFSWTAFFNVIDRTLPAGVMLTAIRPQHGDDGVAVAVGVIGRRLADIDAFIELLEATGAFADVLAREEEMLADGTYRARLTGRYRPDRGGGRAAGEAAP